MTVIFVSLLLWVMARRWLHPRQVENPAKFFVAMTSGRRHIWYPRQKTFLDFQVDVVHIGIWRLLSILFIIFWAGGDALAASTPPVPAREAGYKVNTLSSTSATAFSGWFPWGFFSGHAAADRIKINADHSLTLLGDVTGPNGEIATAQPDKNPQGFRGIAFGGGAYIEAVLKFNPDDVFAQGKKGWPSFWAMSLEHLIGRGDQWPNRQLGYHHFVEADFFEYDTATTGDRNNYGVNLHDWYGLYNVSCAPSSAFCDFHPPHRQLRVAVPETVDFTRYHTYGFLWVPATAGHQGYARYYFDGMAVGPTVTWDRLGDQEGKPDNQAWAFGVLDTQHLVVILGTGVNEPMDVQSVNVWQKSDAENLVSGE